jgi:hypothetical protein
VQCGSATATVSPLRCRPLPRASGDPRRPSCLLTKLGGSCGLERDRGPVEEWLTRSPTLCLANLAVLEASRYPMACRGHLFSTTPGSDDPLLDTVRTRLGSGTLFPVERKSGTGRGSGKPCAVCDLPINHVELEYEVDPHKLRQMIRLVGLRLL